MPAFRFADPQERGGATGDLVKHVEHDLALGGVCPSLADEVRDLLAQIAEHEAVVAQWIADMNQMTAQVAAREAWVERLVIEHRDALKQAEAMSAVVEAVADHVRKGCPDPTCVLADALANW